MSAMSRSVPHGASEVAATPMLRDPLRRGEYLKPFLRAVPRLLASVDRNPFGPSYGCCDRQYWHYRTAAFPSEMYQEAALPLALAYVRRLPGNRWYGEPRLAEAATAAIRFSARTAHADGSADDYYPQERALGAVVFSLQAQTEAYRLLRSDDADLLRFFHRRAWWIAEHGESGRLTNHHALAALALWRTADLTGDEGLRRAALAKVDDVVASQHGEGWFPEYGGADPGYQTVTIDCLAKLRRLADLPRLDEPLRRATAFARWFQHPDGGYGGEYGSRGTRHFHAHGFELAAAVDADAADLADGFLRSLAGDTAAELADDRMYAHRLAGLVEAYEDWTPRRPPSRTRPTSQWFAGAGLFVHRDARCHVIVSTARGGTLHVHRVDGAAPPLVDAGLVVETATGHVGVSQTHDLKRPATIDWFGDDAPSPAERPGERRDVAAITVVDSLRRVRFERATPFKQALLHLGMTLLGRFGRTAARTFLQRRTIAAGRTLPLRHARKIHLVRRHDIGPVVAVEIVDELELLDAALRVRRLSFAADLQAAYTAAAETYQHSILQPWHDLAEHVDALNTRRRTVVRRTIEVGS